MNPATPPPTTSRSNPKISHGNPDPPAAWERSIFKLSSAPPSELMLPSERHPAPQRKQIPEKSNPNTHPTRTEMTPVLNEPPPQHSATPLRLPSSPPSQQKREDALPLFKTWPQDRIRHKAAPPGSKSRNPARSDPTPSKNREKAFPPKSAQATSTATRPTTVRPAASRHDHPVRFFFVGFGFSDDHFRKGLPIARQMESNVIV